MRLAFLLAAALLGLAPGAALAHGGHQHEPVAAAPVAEAQTQSPSVALTSPCPGGNEQSCACRSLAGCRDGKAIAPAVYLRIASTPVAYHAPVVRSAPPVRFHFSPSRPRAPPASS